jgi:hypothetical protein
VENPDEEVMVGRSGSEVMAVPLRRSEVPNTQIGGVSVQTPWTEVGRSGKNPSEVRPQTSPERRRFHSRRSCHQVDIECKKLDIARCHRRVRRKGCSTMAAEVTVEPVKAASRIRKVSRANSWVQ